MLKISSNLPRLIFNQLSLKLLKRNLSSHLPVTQLSEDELLMKETVKKLANEKIKPVVKEMEKNGKFHPEIVQLLFDNGLMGVEIPQEYDGSGSNFMTTIQVIEELAKVDASIAILVDIQNTLVNAILMKIGTKEQKEKYLPLLATKWSSSFALSETTSGSDAFSLKTTAKTDGDHFILNGSKMWISNSDIAQLFLVMVNAKPEAGYKGITCFLVERDTPGFTIAKPESKLGLKASGTCMLNFEDCRVHKSQILGQFGHGYKYAAGFLNEGRVGVAAQMLGIAQGCYDATLPYLFERKQFGQELYRFQAVQHRVARLRADIEQARLLTYNAARLVENKMDFIKEAAMAKVVCAEVAQKTTIECINLMGGVGFTTDFPQEKFYRDCKVGSIYEGTTHIQLSTIAKLIEKEFTK